MLLVEVAFLISSNLENRHVDIYAELTSSLYLRTLPQSIFSSFRLFGFSVKRLVCGEHFPPHLHVTRSQRITRFHMRAGEVLGATADGIVLK